VKLKSAFPFVLIIGAASSAPTFAAESGATTGIEEVVVTARYKEESAQDAPVAVSAFSAVMLDKLVAQDMRDVGPSAPNVRIQPVVTFQNSAAVHIRGMGGQGIESTEEMRAGVSINGVFISRPIATLIDLFDVETIEVLRGPQGTTFGKNSLVGGINITTKRPDGAWAFEGDTTLGNYGRMDVRAAVEFPIMQDILSGRVSVLSQNYDGHFRNRVNGDNLNGEDLDTIRGTLVFTPSEAFDATVIYTRLKENSTAPGGENDPDPFQILQFKETDGDPFTVGRDALDFADTDQDGTTVIANWDLGSFVLTSVTGWLDTDDFIASDFDQTEVLFFPTFRDQTHDQFSSELRLATDFSDREGFLGNLDLVLGLFYFEQEHELVQSFPVAVLGFSADYAHQEDESQAIFGQAIYALNDRINFSFGVRYTDEKKDFERNPGVPALAPDPYNPFARPSIEFMSTQRNPVTQLMPVNGHLDSDNVSIRTGFDYRLKDNVLTYASYAQGFKAGEFGARANTNFTATPTDDETSDAYEIGVKSDWLEGRLRVNAAAFYTTYEDLQFSVFVQNPDNPTGQETAVQNIGEATTYGLELETTWLATDNLTLEMNLGLLHAEYDEFCADLNGPQPAENPVSECGGRVQETEPDSGIFFVDTDYTYLDLSRAPETELYLAAEYVFPTAFGTITPRVSTNYEDEFFTEGSNNPKGKTGDYWLWDTSITWQSVDEHWRVQAWCKNCGDKEYVMGLTPTANFFNQKFWGNPLVYGVTLGYRP